MEPMKPEVKRAILEANPQAEPGDIEEYERLLSLQFTVDPDAGPGAAPEDVRGLSRKGTMRPSEAIQSRLKELQAKLFPAKKWREK